MEAVPRVQRPESAPAEPQIWSGTVYTTVWFCGPACRLVSVVYLASSATEVYVLRLHVVQLPQQSPLQLLFVLYHDSLQVCIAYLARTQ